MVLSSAWRLHHFALRQQSGLIKRLLMNAVPFLFSFTVWPDSRFNRHHSNQTGNFCWINKYKMLTLRFWNGGAARQFLFRGKVQMQFMRVWTHTYIHTHTNAHTWLGSQTADYGRRPAPQSSCCHTPSLAGIPGDSCSREVN